MDLYTCEIHFNSVRLIAVFIICLGFLMLLLPEDWDQCIIQLSQKLRKRDEPAEGSGEAGAGTGLNWRGRARTSMSTYALWIYEISSHKHIYMRWEGNEGCSPTWSAWFLAFWTALWSAAFQPRGKIAFHSFGIILAHKLTKSVHGLLSFVILKMIRYNWLNHALILLYLLIIPLIPRLWEDSPTCLIYFSEEE